MTGGQPRAIRALPEWAKVIVVMASLAFAGTAIVVAWRHVSELQGQLAFGVADARALNTMAEAHTTNTVYDTHLVAHILDVQAHLKGITNRQSLGLMGVAVGVALFAIGFGLFVLGADAAFKLQAEGKGAGTVVLQSSSPAILCFVLGTIIAAIGVTRPHSLDIGVFGPPDIPTPFPKTDAERVALLRMTQSNVASEAASMATPDPGSPTAATRAWLTKQIKETGQ